MSGILDFLDSPDLLSNLLGISSANAAEARSPAPTPLPPKQGGALGSPTPVQTSSLGPSGGMAPSPPMPPPQDYNFGPNMSFDQRAAPVQADIANGVTDPQGGNFTDFSRNPNQPNPPASGGGTLPAMAPPENVAGPGVIPRPPMPPNGGPVQMADASGRVPIPGPQAAPPPPASVMSQPGGPPVTNTSGGLMSSLGFNPNAMQIGFAGLGRGLSAVGAQPDGTSAGRSFAAGAGGALTGSNQQVEHNQAQVRQQQNDLFNQKSTAFKDWVEGEKLGNQTMIDQARAKYFEAFAAQKKAGAGGSNAWQNTPYGKAQALEKMLDTWENQQRLQLNAKWKAVGSTPEEVQSDLANLQKQKEAERTRRSKALGIDPDEHLNGTTSDKPFDFNKLTPQQRLDVPDGAFYKYHDPSDPKADKSGDVIKQRDWLSTPPYEGWQPSGVQSQQQQPAMPSPAQVEYQAGV